MINRDRARVGSASSITFGFVTFTAGFLACFALDGLHSAKPKRGLEPMQHSAGPPPVSPGPGIVADATQPITLDGFPLMPEPDERNLTASEATTTVAPRISDVADLAALDREIARLNEQVGELERRLDRCGTSAYALAWQSGELDHTTEAEQEAVRVVLEYAPILPGPSETLWILDRVRFQDWTNWGDMEAALVWRFGEQRLRDAVGNQKFEELFSDG